MTDSGAGVSWALRVGIGDLIGVAAGPVPAGEDEMVAPTVEAGGPADDSGGDARSCRIRMQRTLRC